MDETLSGRHHPRERGRTMLTPAQLQQFGHDLLSKAITPTVIGKQVDGKPRQLPPMREFAGPGNIAVVNAAGTLGGCMVTGSIDQNFTLTQPLHLHMNITVGPFTGRYEIDAKVVVHLAVTLPQPLTIAVSAPPVAAKDVQVSISNEIIGEILKHAPGVDFNATVAAGIAKSFNAQLQPVMVNVASMIPG
ncbi:MAG TPA: hypothetical protein VG651_11510 [Stellaceae bacterium]|nr:hypothetical protein [Stellaceae bacterium]